MNKTQKLLFCENCEAEITNGYFCDNECADVYEQHFGALLEENEQATQKLLYQLEDQAIGRFMEAKNINVMDLIEDYLDENEQAQHVKLSRQLGLYGEYYG